MTEELTLSMRPKTFDDMVGSEKLLKRIRKIFDSKDKIPKNYLLSGQSGAGKTTMARIIALSVQCRHQKKFGHPCRKCRRHSADFNIQEINMSDKTGIDYMRKLVDEWYYVPNPGSRKRVYILNECHRLTENAQDAMNQPMEDCPSSTMIILVTTRPDRILDTIQQRCTLLSVPSLELEGVSELVKRGLKILHSKRSISDLAEKLFENRITSPRLVVKATQHYADTDSTAEEAAQLMLVGDADVYSICRSVIKGSWDSVSKALSTCKPDDNIAIRKSVGAYLNAILLNDASFSNKSNLLSKAIIQLNEIGDDFPATVASLYKICKYFSKESV